jgi:hypothetical protein
VYIIVIAIAIVIYHIISYITPLVNKDELSFIRVLFRVNVRVSYFGYSRVAERFPSDAVESPCFG